MVVWVEKINNWLQARDEDGRLENWLLRFRRAADRAALLLIPASMVWILCRLDNPIFAVTVISPEVTRWIARYGYGMLALTLLYFGWMFFLALRRYREVESVADDARLPRCAVVVPAYNEGRHVCATLESILRSDYPMDKLEIIAVNDGSTDDTWSWIQRAALRAHGRIRTINLERNQGKRGAMYAGFTASSGDVLVTIDSDSKVLPDTLRRLLSPFVDRPEIGAVAGNVKVMNLDGGLIPRMLDVNFVFSFDLMRAAQSALRAVFCAPGALTACRRQVVMPHLDAWLHQKFWGRPSNIGEDRALTNLILRAGYAVVFQRSAEVLTKVPEDYRGLCNMMIRWARSNVRENLDMLNFAFRPRRAAYGRLALAVNLAMQLCWMVTPVLGGFLLLYCMVATLGAFAAALLPLLVLSAVLPMGGYLCRRGSEGAGMAYLYAVFGIVVMIWIAPFAMFSFHRSGWLTR